MKLSLSPSSCILFFSLLGACSTQSQANTPEETGIGGAGATDSGGASNSGGSGVEPKMEPEPAKTQGTAECPWPADGRAAVSLTYDGGMSSQLRNAIPALKERDLQATFFVTKVNNDQDWKDVLAAGHELAAHTFTHPCPRSYGTPTAKNEEFTLDSMASALDADIAQLKRLGGGSNLTLQEVAFVILEKCETRYRT